MNIDYLSNPNLLPQPEKHPMKSAVYKYTPADFVVKEIMNIDFSNQGEHLWLEIKKVGINTTHLANQLAKWAKIPQRDVGYSGIKDRHAVTTQWFSLRIPQQTQPPTEFIIHDENTQEFAEVISTHWHNKKLNRSTHKFNYFKIHLRDIIGDKEKVEQRLHTISQQGVPNYFGLQRFGRNGNNISTALEWFESDTIYGKKPHPKKSRDKQSILLSAARSAIFNQILAKRILDGNWQSALKGEVLNLNGTGSVFLNTHSDDEIKNRIETCDIHPTGCMWGLVSEKSTVPIEEALDCELSVIQSDEKLKQLAQGLENKKLKAARRSLRLIVRELNWHWAKKDSQLTLEFILPSGSYATVLLMSLVKELTESNHINL